MVFEILNLGPSSVASESSSHSGLLLFIVAIASACVAVIVYVLWRRHHRSPAPAPMSPWVPSPTPLPFSPAPHAPSPIPASKGRSPAPHSPSPAPHAPTPSGVVISKIADIPTSLKSRFQTYAAGIYPGFKPHPEYWKTLDFLWNLSC